MLFRFVNAVCKHDVILNIRLAQFVMLLYTGFCLIFLFMLVKFITFLLAV